jgi:hypothetical protein
MTNSIKKPIIHLISSAAKGDDTSHTNYIHQITNIENMQDGDKRKCYGLKPLGEAFASITVGDHLSSFHAKT